MVRVALGVLGAVLLASCSGATPTAVTGISTAIDSVTSTSPVEIPSEESSPVPEPTVPDVSHKVTPDDVTLMVPATLADIERVGWDNSEGAPYSSVVYFRGEAQYGLHVADAETGFPIGQYVLGHTPPPPTVVVSSAVGDLAVFSAEELGWPDGGVVVATGICGGLELWQESRASLDVALSDLIEIIEHLDCR